MKRAPGGCKCCDTNQVTSMALRPIFALWRFALIVFARKACSFCAGARAPEYLQMELTGSFTGHTPSDPNDCTTEQCNQALGVYVFANVGGCTFDPLSGANRRMAQCTRPLEGITFAEGVVGIGFRFDTPDNDVAWQVSLATGGRNGNLFWSTPPVPTVTGVDCDTYPVLPAIVPQPVPPNSSYCSGENVIVTLNPADGQPV